MTEQRVQRRLAAIPAADVAGYSRLMGGADEGTLTALSVVYGAGRRASEVVPRAGHHWLPACSRDRATPTLNPQPRSTSEPISVAPAARQSPTSRPSPTPIDAPAKFTIRLAETTRTAERYWLTVVSKTDQARPARAVVRVDDGRKMFIETTNVEALRLPDHLMREIFTRRWTGECEFYRCSFVIVRQCVNQQAYQ